MNEVDRPVVFNPFEGVVEEVAGLGLPEWLGVWAYLARLVEVTNGR